MHEHPAPRKRYKRISCVGSSKSAGNMWLACPVHSQNYRKFYFSSSVTPIVTATATADTRKVHEVYKHNIHNKLMK